MVIKKVENKEFFLSKDAKVGSNNGLNI